MRPPAGGAPRLSRRALLEAGAVAGAAALLGGCGGAEDERPDTAADAALLADLLARETAVVAALGSALETLRGADARSARAMLADDRRHVERLARELRERGGAGETGARERAAAAPGRPGETALAALEPALASKQAALAAHADAVARLGDGALRAAVLRMAGEEAGHAAALRLLLGADPAPDAFAGLA